MIFKYIYIYNLCSHLLCPDFLCPMARRLASMTGTAMRPQLSPAITVLTLKLNTRNTRIDGF